MKDFKQYVVNFKSPYSGENMRMIPVKGNYAMDDSLAVTLFDLDNMEDYAMMTKCFPDSFHSNESTSFIDKNNCDWAPKFLEENKIAEPTGYSYHSGYCDYPEYKFDESKLVTYDELASYYRLHKNFDFENNETLDGKEKGNKIRVLVKEPNKPLEEHHINNEIEELQSRVDGYIDMTNLPGSDNIDIICNDEFLYNGSLPNIMVPERRNVFCGTLIFAGYNEEDGSTISLTDGQVKEVEKYVKENELKSGIDIYGAFDAMSKKAKACEME